MSWCHIGWAQFRGAEMPGGFGLSAGTQDDPSLSISIFYDGYRTSKLKNGNGDIVFRNFTMPSQDVSAGLNIVTNYKILGANYGAEADITFSANRIESVIVREQSKLGFTDMFVEPIELGWHRKYADFLAGYNMYLPTGKYVYGGENNYGLGMWTYEWFGGATVYLDSEKTWALSSIAFYETHSRKRGTPYRVGDILVVEGGISKSFSVKAGSNSFDFELGPTYYTEFKTTYDQMPPLLSHLIRYGGKDRVFGWGGELVCQAEKPNLSFSIRWLYETGAQTRFEGQTLVAALTQRLVSFRKGADH